MLSDIGSWASILSLPITIWVLIETFRIKGHFSARARIPEIRKSLADVSLSYLGNIKTNGDKNLAFEDLARIIGLLKSLQAKPAKKSLTTLGPTIAKINRICESRLTSENDLWGAYTSTIEIITSLEQIERDMTWK